MSPLFAWRQEIRGCISRGFLRRDQGEGLYISDFPLREEGGGLATLQKLQEAGFTVSMDAGRGLAHVDAAPFRYARLLENLETEIFSPLSSDLLLWGLAKRLLLHPVPFEKQPLPLLRLTIKMLEAGETALLRQKLGAECALLQRKKLPLPFGAGQMILAYLHGKGGNTSC